MKQYAETKCLGCGKADPVKNGHSKNGAQRYRCEICKKSFRIDCSCNAWRSGVKEQIEKQTLNSSGVRDISRNPSIAKGTVISGLKKKRHRK